MKCVICNKEISGRFHTNVWGQAACMAHNVSRCYSCDKFILPNDIVLDDGRGQCCNCLSVTVCLPSHIKWVKERVFGILRKAGIHDLPVDVPVTIVSPRQMADISGSGEITTMQAGLARHKEYGLPFFNKKEHNIYILNMLSRLHFAGVFAHELMHVWIHEKGINLRLQDEEGICNVASYIVYCAADSNATKVHIKRLEENPDPIYGDGFRNAKEVFENCGRNITKAINILEKRK